jgi:hypothetical protein
VRLRLTFSNATSTGNEAGGDDFNFWQDDVLQEDQEGHEELHLKYKLVDQADFLTRIPNPEGQKPTESRNWICNTRWKNFTCQRPR